MIEKIYTIPVNEAFDRRGGCPFCDLYAMLESNELDMILGASMMEPAIRIETNKKGFCGKHYDIMFKMQNRLGLALIIQSHLSENIVPSLKGGILSKALGKKRPAGDGETCFICGRVEKSLAKMFETAALLYESEKEFRLKLEQQPYFCIKHYNAVLLAGEYVQHKKVYPDFATSCKSVMNAYAQKLLDDVSWFVKKFDYNYQNEPWGDAKDSVERAICFLADYKSLESLRGDREKR